MPNFSTQDADDAIAQVSHAQDAVTASQIRSNVAEAVNVDPDSEAQAQHLARTTDFPLDTVRANPDAAKVRSAVMNFGADALVNQAPKTAKLLTNPDKAKLAHDDIPALAQLETAVKGPLLKVDDATGEPTFAADAIADVLKGGATGLGASYNNAAAAFNTVLGPFARMLGGEGAEDKWFKAMVDPRIEAAKSLTPGPEASWSEKAGYTAGNLLGMLSQIMLTGGAGEAAPAVAAADTAPTAVGIASKAVEHATKSMMFPALTSSVNTGREVYGATGDWRQAFDAAQMEYATQTGMGIMPLSMQGGALARVASGAVSGVLTGEASRQAMNTVLPVPMQHPFTVEDATMTALAGAMMGGVMGPRASERPEYHDAVRQTYVDHARADDAEQAVGQLSQISQAAAVAKLRERDPGEFREFVKNVAEDGNLKAVYVDASTLLNALHQSEIPAAEFVSKMPGVTEQIAEAHTTKGMVRIPIEDYATNIAGSPIEPAILGELRSAPDAMTYNEAKAYKATESDRLNAQVADVVDRKAGNDVRDQDRATVYDNMLDQLTTAARFPAEVNRGYATIAADMYATLGERNGMTATEAMAKYPLKVAVEQLAGAGSEYQQSVYHGSAIPDIHEFDSAKIGTGQGAASYGFGHYFGEAKATGESYRGILAGEQVKTPAGQVLHDSNEAGASVESTPEKTAFAALKYARDSGAKHQADFAELVLRKSIADKNLDPDMREEAKQAIEVLKEWKAKGGELKPGGAVYHVDLPDEMIGRMLHHDKPVSEQPEHVQSAVQRAFDEAGIPGAMSEKPDGDSAYTWIASALQKTGNDRAGARAASALLSKHGVPGVKYLDQGSRAAGEGTHNYVVFPGEEKNLKILDRYFQNGGGNKTETPEFKSWFGKSAVVDDAGKPLVVYHGAGRPDRIGDVFRKSRATAGPMAFFTDSHDIAGKYAEGKSDTSLDGSELDYPQWFKWKAPGSRSPVDIVRAWWHLTPEERATIAERAPEVTRNDDGEIVREPGNKTGIGNYDYEIKQSHGNSLKALVEGWLNSGALFNDEHQFIAVLKEVGFPTKGLDYVEQNANNAAVLPVYLKVEHPLETNAIPENVYAALNEAGKGKRGSGRAGPDQWSKESQSGAEWLAKFNGGKDNIDGDTYAWTSIPDWVTAKLKELGYDGIHDTGGKGGGDKHSVWIPFEQNQVKSATGNRGTFDPNSDSILKQGPKGAYDPTTGTIALLKNADLSTFIHELGHHGLEMMADIAGAKDAPADVSHDFGTLLKWFGVSDVNEWNGLSVDEKRSYHEQFAEGFEKYIAEGKAPSVELQSVFSKMRSWLLNVYQSLTNMRVELTPEVRGVMDRLLASKEAISAAESVRGYEPLFKSAAEAGMTPERFAEYQATGREATQKAIDEMQDRSARDMRFLSNAKSRALREAQATAERMRAETRMQVAGEVWKQPIYQAWQFLTGHDVGREPADRAKATAFVHPERDDLLAAIAKLGGLRKGEVVSEFGLDPKEKVDSGVFGKPVFRTESGGMSIDRMVESLAQYGYLHVDEHGKADIAEFEERLGNAVRGGKEVSYAYDHEAGGDKTAADYAGRDAGRIDRNLAKQTASPEAVGKLETLGMLRNGGIDPEVVAEIHGIGNGKDLIEGLAKAEHPHDAIDRLTDERMLQQHGELATPDAVERYAEQAIHNDARARFMATGLSVLTKSQGTAKMINDAAKEAAEAAIAGKKVSDLSPQQYLAAEARSNRQAMLLAARDPNGAASEQRAALLNNRLFKAANEALQNVRDGLDYFKALDKATVRARIDVEYRDQIDAMLARFDLRKSVSAADRARLGNLQNWIESLQNRGYEPAVAEYLANEAYRTHYKDMTVEQFRGLVDAVKSIDYLGREVLKIRDGEKSADFDTVVLEARDKMRELPQREAETNRGLDRIEGKWLKGKAVVRSADASLLKMEQMLDWLDGRNPDGAFNRIVFRRIAESASRETTMRHNVQAQMRALADTLPKDWGKDFSTPIAVPELSDNRAATSGARLTKAQIISLALNTGTESNLTKVIKGEGWGGEQIRATLDRNMTEHDWTFVRGVWEIVGQFYPDIAAMERRLGNTAPEKIAGRTVETKYVNFQGGYYPMVYDRARAFDVDQRSDRSADALFENTYTKATTPKGHTIARTGYAGPVLLSLDVLPRHLAQVTHDLAMREAVIDADRFLSDSRVREGIEAALGVEYYKQLRPWLQSIANDKVFNDAGLGFWDNAAHWARTTTTMVGLGLRFTTMMLHGASAASNSVGELGVKWMTSGANAFLGSPAKMVEARDFIFDRSPEMANRMREFDRDVRDGLRDIEAKGLNGPVGAVTAVTQGARRFAYFGISMLDMASALPTWMGAYNKAMAPEAKGGLAMSESDAVYFADKSVRNAHGGGGTKDLAAAQRGTETWKLATMFYSFWSHFYNRQRDTGRMAMGIPADISAGDYAGARRDFAMVLARSWWYFVIPALLHGAIKPPPTGHDDDKENFAMWTAKELGLALTSGVPILRDVANAMANGRDYQATPAEGIVRNLFATADDVKAKVKGEPVSDKWLRHAIETSGYTFGLPLGQPAASVQFLWDTGTGRVHPTDLADWYKGIVHGDMRR